MAKRDDIATLLHQVDFPINDFRDILLQDGLAAIDLATTQAEMLEAAYLLKALRQAAYHIQQLKAEGEDHYGRSNRD